MSADLEDPGKALLQEIADGTTRARALRYEIDDTFDEIDDETLVRIARWLRAGAYSMATGADHLLGVVRRRHPETEDFDPETLAL